MPVAFKSWLYRIHRWIGVALAPVFLLVILSGAVLAFRPNVGDLAAQAGGANPPALTSLVSRLEASGPVRAIVVGDGGKSVQVTSGASVGTWDIASGDRTASAGRVDIFSIAQKLHKSLLLGLGFVVEAASFAMLAAVVIGPFLAPMRFRNSLSGWHKAAGWVLYPVVLALPLTAALMSLGVDHGGARPPVSATPITISQALERATPQVDLTQLTGARQFRGGSALLEVAGGDKYVVTDRQTVKFAGSQSLVQQIHKGTWAGAWSGALNFFAAMALLGLSATGFWSWVKRELRRRQNRGAARQILSAARA